MSTYKKDKKYWKLPPNCAWLYVDAVKTMTQYPGSHGIKDRIDRLHDEICKYYGLTKEQIQKVTDNMPDNWYGPELHEHLIGIIESNMEKEMA